LTAWENEALLVLQEQGPGRFEQIVPSCTILAEPPVALVERNVDRRGNRRLAQAYLEYLYSDTGQEIAARHHFRPRAESVLRKHAKQFAQVDLFTIDSLFGGWQKAQQLHFAEGGTFDQIYRR
jgi:sulfate transport system substrate-binding protein